MGFLRRFRILFILGVWVFAGCDRPQQMNVVVITVDTLRADHLGCYGYDRNTSPRIDAFAARGILFTDVSSVIDNTVPSHISIFTGMYPKHHKVYTNWNLQDVGPVTLAQILKAHGYRNAAFVSSFILASDKVRLDKGFDSYKNTDRLKIPADETIGDAAEWIRKNGKAKFFVWIHLFDPHMPYNPPRPFDRLYDPDYNGWGKTFFDALNHKAAPSESLSTPGLTKGQKETLRGMAQGRFNLLDVTYNKIGLGERDMKYVKSLYDGEISFMDQQVGRLLDELEKLGLNNRTVVILTADHGESLGEHGIYWDHKGIYEPEIKIPMVIYVPGRGSRKVDGMVSNLDIVPTLIDLLHLSVRPEVLRGLDGKSLLPMIDGKGKEVREEMFIEQSNNMGKSIKKNEYKYIMPVKENFPHFPNDYRHEEALYHLKNDPGEKTNLRNMGSLQDSPYENLHESLLRWAGESLLPAKGRGDLEKLDNEQREKLKALGYIN